VGHFSYAIEGKQYLRVDRLLDPGGTVLIEGGDAVFGRTNFGLPLSVVVLTNSRIACFAGPSFTKATGRLQWSRLAGRWGMLRCRVIAATGKDKS